MVGSPGIGYMGMGSGYLTSQPAGMFFRTESLPMCWGAAGSSATHMTLLASGNFGIGLTNPGSTLHINRAGGVEFKLSDSNNTSIIKTVQDGVNSHLAFAPHETVRMTILGSNGNVGIGTTSPGYPLDVDGVARFRSTTRFAPGSAAWPSITYHSDVDTGIWFPGDGTVAISTNGTEAFRLDTSQNAKFAAIVTAVGRLQVTGNGTPTVTGGGLELGYKSSESSSKILSIDRNGNAYRALELAASSHSFKIGTTVKFDINASGNATFAGTVSGVTNMATVTSDIDSSPTIYVDNDAPSGGVTGDIWLEY